MTEAGQPGTQPSQKIRNAVTVFKRYPVIPVFIVLTLIFTAIFANMLGAAVPGTCWAQIFWAGMSSVVFCTDLEFPCLSL